MKEICIDMFLIPKTMMKEIYNKRMNEKIVGLEHYYYYYFTASIDFCYYIRDYLDGKSIDCDVNARII
jgi:hypothetical protein